MVLISEGGIYWVNNTCFLLYILVFQFYNLFLSNSVFNILYVYVILFEIMSVCFYGLTLVYSKAFYLKKKALYQESSCLFQTGAGQIKFQNKSRTDGPFELYFE